MNKIEFLSSGAKSSRGKLKKSFYCLNVQYEIFSVMFQRYLTVPSLTVVSCTLNFNHKCFLIKDFETHEQLCKLTKVGPTVVCRALCVSVCLSSRRGHGGQARVCSPNGTDYIVRNEMQPERQILESSGLVGMDCSRSARGVCVSETCAFVISPLHCPLQVNNNKANTVTSPKDTGPAPALVYTQHPSDTPHPTSAPPHLTPPPGRRKRFTLSLLHD